MSAAPHLRLFLFVLCSLFCNAFSSEKPEPVAIVQECPDISIVETELSACDAKTVQLTRELETAVLEAQSHVQSIQSAEASSAEHAEALALLKKEKAELENIARQWVDRAEELNTSLQTAKAEASRAMDDAASCSKEDTVGRAALLEERDALQTSRLQLASELETTKGALTAAKSTNTELQQTIDQVLKPQVEELINCKKSKASLKQDLEKSKTTCKSVVAEAQRAAQIDKEKLTAEVKVLKEKEDLTLFSAKRLNDAFKRCYIFTRCLARYIAEKVYRVVLEHVPEGWEGGLRQTWHDNVTVNWNAKIVPVVSNMIRKFQTNEVVRMSDTIYHKNIHPHWTGILSQTRETVGSALTAIRAYSLSYVKVANDYITASVVAPITRQFPEMNQLLPTSFVDRLCCLAYVYFVYLHVLRHACFVMKCCMVIVFFPLKVLLPCIYRRNESDKGKKVKRHRPKTFQPAAMTAIPTNVPKGKDNSHLPKESSIEKESQTARRAKGAKV